jgi:hypothetical protein
VRLYTFFGQIYPAGVKEDSKMSLSRHNECLSSYNAVLFSLSTFAATYTLFSRRYGSVLLAIWLMAFMAFIGVMSHTKLPAIVSRIPSKTVWITIVILIVVLVLAAYREYPISSIGAKVGDRDEALELAVRAVMRGDYPYYERTSKDVGLHNLITPFPGAILLAFPFVLIGYVVFQNYFWLSVFFLTVRAELASVQWAGFAFLLFVFTPAILGETRHGGDLVTNAVYVLVAGTLLIRAYYEKTSRLEKYLYACFFGVTLASRSIFVLVLPQIFAMIFKRGGVRSASVSFLVTCATGAAITLPFILYDPAGFTPLNANNIITSAWNHLVPFSNVWIPGIALLTSFILASKCKTMAQVHRNCAIVLAIPVIAVIVLSNYEALILRKEPIILYWMNYIEMAIPFAVFGWIEALHFRFGESINIEKTVTERGSP